MFARKRPEVSFAAAAAGRDSEGFDDFLGMDE
jgi:hypothetical protein